MGKKLVVGVILDGNRRAFNELKQQGKAKALPDVYRLGAKEGIKVVEGASAKGIGRIVFYALSHYDIRNRRPWQIQAVSAGIKEFCRLLPEDVQVHVWGDYCMSVLEEVVDRSVLVEDPLVVDLLVGYSADWDLETRPIRTKAIPKLDFVVRPGGRRRLSDFLPYQTGYAQLYFDDRLWALAGNQIFEAAFAQYLVDRSLEDLAQEHRGA